MIDTARHLTDHIGSRLTGSPALKEANEWTRDTLREWGVEADLEGFEIDHGWTLERCQVHMLTPYAQPLFALPKAWTPGTDGPQRGRVVRATLESPEDFEELKGQLNGAILLLDDAREPYQIEGEFFKRYDDEDLTKAENSRSRNPAASSGERDFRRCSNSGLRWRSSLWTRGSSPPSR